MKVSTMIFLCSLICFATCTKPIFSEALRSSASIDLDSPDQALIQTQSKNKVKSLAFARQNAQVAQAPKPAATQPAATQPAAAQPSAAQPAAAQPSAAQPKPAATQPAATQPAAAQPKPAATQPAASNAAAAPTAGAKTTSDAKLNTSGTATSKRTSGSSFIVISTTVLAMLFALF